MANEVLLKGVLSGIKYNHRRAGEDFYRAYIRVERKSGTPDILPVIISTHMLSKECEGAAVSIQGEFRSYNWHDGKKTRLLLYVYAKDIELIHGEMDPINNNRVYLEGFICKAPKHRRTPLGKDIADFTLAVNRKEHKSDYLPCVAWGDNALWAEGLQVGTRVSLSGRIQSREYVKETVNGPEIRTAYELSVRTMEEMYESDI